MTGSALNIIIKLIALLLAVLLWFNVITQKQYDYELSLPVTSLELPPGLTPVNAFPDFLTVKVQAEGKKLLKSDWKDAGLRLRATRLQRGVNNFECNIETVALVRSEDVNLLELLGRVSYSIHLDRTDSILKPVASRLTTLAAAGHVIVAGRGGIDPVKTQVIGPLLVLNRIDSIHTESKIIDGLRETTIYTLKLIAPGETPVQLSHDSARVEVVVDKIAQRRYEDVPIVISGLPVGRRAVVDPEHVGLTISGPESFFDSLHSRDFRVVVRPQLQVGDGYAIPEVSLPPNFTTESITPDSIRIVINP